jgi:sortase A
MHWTSVVSSPLERVVEMRIVETGLLIVGVFLLAVYGGMSWWGEAERHRSLAEFSAARQTAALQQPATLPGQAPVGAATSGAGAEAAMPPPPSLSSLAVLRVPGVDLEVPVHAGTAESVLSRGAGLIEGTATPGSHGNVGIAAHRDSFFRPLERVAIGDLIELDTLERTIRYRITELSVVEPTDVHVLDEIGKPVLTLVTCYPFRFVGNAPQRYIVRAVAVDVPQPEEESS